MTMHPTLATALERIAAREGCAVTALPPLYATIDPEALATVLESEAEVSVCFEYCGYRSSSVPYRFSTASIYADRKSSVSLAAVSRSTSNASSSSRG